MPKLFFITSKGDRHATLAPSGTTISEAGVDNKVEGAKPCDRSTHQGCHVLIEEAWAQVLDEPSPSETAILEQLPGRRPNSRLSCRIILTSDLDGLVVTIQGASA